MTETSTTRSRTRTIRLRSAFAWVLVAALAACDGDADPAGPAGPAGSGPDEATLESNELLSGGTGVLVSAGFAGLELEPAVDDEGLIRPERWTNLRVTVGGVETDARRLDDRRIEFSVPTLPAGTVGVDVSSPLVHGSASARVLGILESTRVVPCFIRPREGALVLSGDAVFFDTECAFVPQPRAGVGVTWPAEPGRGFEWLDCFGTADVSRDRAAPVEVGDGTCLLIVPDDGVILRDGEPFAEWPRFHFGHFVMSDDGWATARNGARLVIFDATGDLVVDEDRERFVQDARFAPGGGPLYVATEDRLQVIDRGTGELLRETTVTGTVDAIAVSTDRLWIARSTETLGGELFVELLDPGTLEPRRRIAVSQDLATSRRSSTKRRTTVVRIPRKHSRHSTPELSGEPGAVHERGV